MHIETAYRAVRTFGVRTIDQIRTIVLHASEHGASVKEDVMHYRKTAAFSSVHVTSGVDGIYRLLPDDVVAWGAPGCNRSGLHVEIGGLSCWTREEWETVMPSILNAAKVVARWCAAHDIEPKWLQPIELLRGEKGLALHSTVDEAFEMGDHLDPGPGFPTDIFLDAVRSEMELSSKDK